MKQSSSSFRRIYETTPDLDVSTSHGRDTRTPMPPMQHQGDPRPMQQQREDEESRRLSAKQHNRIAA